jgi:hypothetical protein
MTYDVATSLAWKTTCVVVGRTGHITSSVTHKQYKTKTNINCKTNNIIYSITCRTCGLQYIGQTLRTIQDRFQLHFYSITSTKQNVDTTVGRHFRLPDHRGLMDFEIHVLDFIHQAPRSASGLQIRNKIELNWIHHLRTPAPLGLNMLD